MDIGLRAESSNLDRELLSREWPDGIYKGIYLNSGSCGVKPKSVLAAIQNGWNQLNQNPTLMSFIDSEPWNAARSAAAKLCGIPEKQLVLIPNSSFGIQLVMQSFLVQAGDEFVTSDQEHRCVNTLARYLEETRGIVVSRFKMKAETNSQELCQGILDRLSRRTRLVLLSQINCLTGWRPQFDELCTQLKTAGIPLLVDGAHAPGQGPLSLESYPLWIASCHKWMGAPNSSGLLKATPEYMERLKPLLIGDRLYDESFELQHRLEWHGTSDVVKLLGLRAAIELQLKLGPARIAERQLHLQKYLRTGLSTLAEATIRTPDLDGERSAMLTIYWKQNQLRVEDLRSALWEKHNIWIQPDFASDTPGRGMRISCNVFNKESEIDALITALSTLLQP